MSWLLFQEIEEIALQHQTKYNSYLYYYPETEDI